MKLRIIAVLACIALASIVASLLAAPQQTLAPPPVHRDFAAGEMPSPDWPRAAVRAKQAMVVSDERLASEAGIDILKKGGNAVDAAVAMGFALAVVLPQAGNMGGGGFMLVRKADGKEAFLDYRETAPGAATRDMYIRADGTLEPDASTLGARSVGVPGTVAGLATALDKFGTMTLGQVMAPAIELAEKGFPVSEKLARAMEARAAHLEKFPVSKKIFLRDGNLYKPGEIFRQPELARTLRRIAAGGADEFYRGGTGSRLAKELKKMGGILTAKDLEKYEVKVRPALHAKFTGGGSEWELMTAPPPSSGGVALIGALEILGPVELKAVEDPASIHWIAETMRRVFADRAEYAADGDFSEVPVRGLTDPRYAEERRATINAFRASPSNTIGAGNPRPFEPANSSKNEPGAPSGDARGMTEAVAWSLRDAAHSEDTTHFSVVDAEGNAVANTYTLNDSFGSAVTVPDGFLLNDTMDDFTSQPGKPNMFGLLQSDANAIQPGKRPVSSMMPTILLRDGKLSFVAGSPGGPSIISAMLLALLNWTRLGVDAQEAINAPRFHHQWMPDILYVEETLPEAVLQDLEKRGHHVKVRSWIGEVEAIAIDRYTGERLGAADARRGGVAIGLP